MQASHPDPSAAGTAPRVQVHTLGRFQISVEGRPLPAEARAHRKPLELLKVLIAQGGAQVSQDSLAEALWPDAEGDQAHGSFTSTLHRARRLIGQDALLLRDRRLTLNAERCWVDAAAFEQALQQATRAADAGNGAAAWPHLERALALYRGPFLEGEFEPPPILTARERLHGVLLRHLRGLGTHYADGGDLPRAVLLYQRGLEIDPLAEELYLALLRAHLALGQTAEGVGVYRRCREMLQAGAGIAPSAEVEALHVALLAARRDAGETTAASEAPLVEALSAAAGAATPPESTPPTVARAARFPPPWKLRGALAGLALLLALGGLLAWSGRSAWVPDDGEAGAALPLPAEPSIVVLPFDNLTGEPAQDYFAKGMSDSLTTQLYKLPGLFVIARQSAQLYQGKAVPARQIGRELGVRYVLEGSVQRSAGRVRINVQLIEAASEKHVWAELYDRALDDVFAAQDAIVRQVATELGVRLSLGELMRTMARATDNYRAFDLYLQADQLFARYEKETNAKAKELLAEAIAEDPKFARAVAFMGWAHLLDHIYRWSEDPAESYRLAEQWARRALAIDENVYLGHTLMGRILMFQGRHEEALAANRRALVSEPSNAIAMGSLARQLIYVGRAEEAVAAMAKAMRLAPNPPLYFYDAAGYAQALAGRHERAVSYFRDYLARQSSGPAARTVRQWLVASLMELGREDEAHALVQSWLEQDPAVTVSALVKHSRRLPFKEHTYLEQQVWHLRRAGLPE